MKARHNRPPLRLTAIAQSIIARFYPGQIPDVVAERAVRQMAIRDGHITRSEIRRQETQR